MKNENKIITTKREIVNRFLEQKLLLHFETVQKYLFSISKKSNENQKII